LWALAVAGQDELGDRSVRVAIPVNVGRHAWAVVSREL
jgi:hypothetical protein